MSDSRACRCCGSTFFTSNSGLEFCSTTCIETFFRLQHEEIDSRKDLQILAAKDLEHYCLVCHKQITALTKRHTPKLYCGPVCVARGTTLKGPVSIVRNCVHCDAEVQVRSNMRPEFVRCDKHRNLWPAVRSQSAKNLKTIKVAQSPYDQYFMKGPWWDHKKKAWTVLLMHSGASSKREMEYARYLLSVKEGSRLNDSIPILYADGDRTNVEISNLALG